jgi:predicted O-methyltransferase YrrM
VNHIDILSSYVQDKDLKEEWYKNNNYYINYYNFGFNYKPYNILELGVRYGYSLLCMIKGSLDSGITNFNITCVDSEHEENSNTIASQNLDKFSNTNNCIINYNFINKEILNITKNDFNKSYYDIIHLDANHSFKVLHEIQITWESLKDNGIMIIDDMGSFQSWTDWIRTKRNHVDNFLQRLISFNQIESINYHNTYRGTYIIKKSNIACSYGEIS